MTMPEPAPGQEISAELRGFATTQGYRGNHAVAELMNRAASVIENITTTKESELQQLRNRLDGWQQYLRLRRDVDEIEKLLDAVFDLNPRRKAGFVLYDRLLQVRLKIRKVREREI
jgi:hypothetical protein